MLNLWPTWVLPVLLAGVWVAVAISEWRHSHDPTPDLPDLPDMDEWRRLPAGNWSG